MRPLPSSRAIPAAGDTPLQRLPRQPAHYDGAEPHRRAHRPDGQRCHHPHGSACPASARAMGLPMGRCPSPPPGHFPAARGLQKPRQRPAGRRALMDALCTRHHGKRRHPVYNGCGLRTHSARNITTIPPSYTRPGCIRAFNTALRDALAQARPQHHDRPGDHAR